MLRFLQLTDAARQPGAYGDVSLMSLTDYAATLQIPGGFNWRRAIVTLLLKTRLSMLLPMAHLVPSGHTEDADDGHDPLEALGGTAMAMSILKAAFSPLQLYAMAEVSNLASASSSKLQTQNKCMKAYLQGSQALDDDLINLPRSFVFEDHLAPILGSLDKQAQPGVVEASGDSIAWLPDLAMESVGLTMRANDSVNRSSAVVAVLLNKLAANGVPGAWHSDGVHCEQSVQLSRTSPKVHTPEDFLESLIALEGTKVYMSVVTRTTSFGVGVAVKEESGWKQVPIAMPCRTGLELIRLDEKDDWVTKPITTLMPHAEVCLRVQSPAVNFRLSWYQGIEGFTGWHASAEAFRPWMDGSKGEVKHGNWTSMSEYRPAFQATSAVAAVTNKAADRCKLPNGGYGYLGVCHDSVASVQAAMGEPVTVFPCILAGSAKRSLVMMYQELAELKHREEAANCESITAAMCEHLRERLLSTPCDVVQDPAETESTCRRVLACIPDETPFTALLECKKDIADLLDTFKSGTPSNNV